MADNTLYYGDNLDVMRRHIREDSIDLIYLDPPFNSDASYNVLFAEQDGSRAAAQIRAFEDTWTWDQASVAAYTAVVEAGGRLAEAMQAFYKLLGGNDLMAYLSMMAPRLSELHRVLKPTGSIYLHCDSTASHYLKILMDSVFGPARFRNEIIWRRTGAHGKARRYGPIHDVILFYVKGDTYTWNNPKRPYMRGHVAEYFIQDADGRWRTQYYGNVLTGSGRRGGESGLPWHGINPSEKNRHWAIPGRLLEEVEEDLSGLGQHEKLDRLLELGLIKIAEGQAWPMYEHYLKPSDGTPVPDIWAYQPYTTGTVFDTEDGIDEDVRWLSPRDSERLGYPTQKPLGIMERIIAASSNVNDIVLDPFCGCGTTIEAAHKLGRQWVGIDITHIAVTLLKVRLSDAFGDDAAYDVVGEPVTLQDARALAEEERFQFQVWALGLVGARPAEIRRGADQGIDGRKYFFDTPRGGAKQIIISVKSGHVDVTDVRELRAVVDREEAEIGVLITMEESTRPMRTEAGLCGTYTSPWGTSHPRLQVLTIEELLGGSRIDYPPSRGDATFKRARRTEPEKPSTLDMFEKDMGQKP